MRENLLTTGSSPLARGLRVRGRPRLPGGGIIPARAGFTPHGAGERCGVADHPRSRGVYEAGLEQTAPVKGSSPLARGLLLRGLDLLAQARIIPARAGFTGRAPHLHARPPDHPRSRGVYTGWRGHSFCGWGSSPLARGLPRRRPGRELRRRIIPARAGFTVERWESAAGARDHPRSRGVYETTVCTASWMPGSSPLARGLPRRRSPGHTVWRIIPARAGFTTCFSSLASPRRDHPRSRGVYSR